MEEKIKKIKTPIAGQFYFGLKFSENRAILEADRGKLYAY